MPEVREAQAELAKEYGIYGFCYYHYWFNGKRLLETPFNEVFRSKKPSFPFCLCWANENWTKAWDGRNKRILIEQKYSHADDLSHINSLIPAFLDERYITIDDKPVLLVYRTELLPDPIRTSAIWKEAVEKAGMKGLYLIRVEGFTSGISPKSIGFDAAVEFAPDWENRGPIIKPGLFTRLFPRNGQKQCGFISNFVSEYEDLSKAMIAKEVPEYTRFRCVTPSWDNSARRRKGAAIFLNSTPRKYHNWLYKMLKQTTEVRSGEEQIIFINAWNEWAEGCHLEPCLKWGLEYLKATCSAKKRLKAKSLKNLFS